ncbi:hypothetical protein AXF42_Ash013883 [Apostasia shenzhenica]|uniref:Uncharacterized protein n=1 Tax=Apostasia shenzhenica TaxID=1088818 RepID=A0A2I0AS57_9ASPA|nr:hypothetical protein AXF42_Ash013883 [Apostasia shenzhenica]
MERWEDQIDVDDSDLQSLLHPFPFPSSSSLQAPSRSLQPCSQIPRSSQNVDHGSSVLPPYWQSQNASQLQDSNRNQGGEDLSKATAFGIQIPGPAGAVQAAMRRKSAAAVAQSPPALEAGGYCHVLDVNEEDEDFKLNPWLCALNFLENGPDSTTTSPISSIIAQQSATERIPQVLLLRRSFSIFISHLMLCCLPGSEVFCLGGWHCRILQIKRAWWFDSIA